MALNAQGKFVSKKEATMSIKNAIAAAAKLLGNTATICRKCYVHPVVLESYRSGQLIEGLRTKIDEAEEVHDFDENERAVLNFLRRQAGETSLNKKIA
jgi:DNA topoisomerase I